MLRWPFKKELLRQLLSEKKEYLALMLPSGERYCGLVS